MLKNPQDRAELIRPFIESLGGRLEGSWLSFGEHQGLAVVEMPNNVAAQAFAMAASATGSYESVKTTPLMTWDEAVESMKKAGGQSK